MKLDTKAFNECLDSGKHTDFVKQQTSFGASLGVRSTPSFIVNGQGVVGAQPFSTFQEMIEKDLP